MYVPSRIRLSLAVGILVASVIVFTQAIARKDSLSIVFNLLPILISCYVLMSCYVVSRVYRQRKAGASFERVHLRVLDLIGSVATEMSVFYVAEEMGDEAVKIVRWNPKKLLVREVKTVFFVSFDDEYNHENFETVVYMTLNRYDFFKGCVFHCTDVSRHEVSGHEEVFEMSAPDYGGKLSALPGTTLFASESELLTLETFLRSVPSDQWKTEDFTRP